MNNLIPTNVAGITNTAIAVAVDNAATAVNRYVGRDYMRDLTHGDVWNLDKNLMDFSQIRMIKISKIILNNDEDINLRLTTIYRMMSKLSGSCFIIIKSSGKQTDIYLGIRSYSTAASCIDAFSNSFSGNFPGSDYEFLSTIEINRLMAQSVSAEDKTTKTVASVSMIPSERSTDTKYVQGLESFINSMSGEEYTAILLATPVDPAAVAVKRRGLENLHTSIAALDTLTVQYGSNTADAYSTSASRSISDSISNGISDSVGYFSSCGYSISKNHTKGTSINLLGVGHSWTASTGTTQSNTGGQNNSHTVNTNKTQTAALTNANVTTVTQGSSSGVTMNIKNKTIAELSKKIDRQLARINHSESYGLWECAAYFISLSPSVARNAASSFSALISGQNSGVEGSYINIWNPINNLVNTQNILRSLAYLIHPYINIGNGSTLLCNPASFISGNELPIMLGLPHKAIDSVPVIRMAEFGRSVTLSSIASSSQLKSGASINIGSIFHMGRAESNRVSLAAEALRGHCFITGTNNSGKSNTTFLLLDGLNRAGCNFLVIEPVKGEYKKVFGNLPGLQIFTGRPDSYRMLKINPFRFAPGIIIREHIDRLVDIFSVCWPMYATMPALLRTCVEQAYSRCGWDLTNSVNLAGTPNVFPTMDDLFELMPGVIDESGYVGDNKGNFTGSMLTRIKSLTTGTYGMIFSGRGDLHDDELFDGKVIVDLSHVGANETKSLLIGILLIRLYEYRMATITQENSPLHHVTVLEEAHNILMRVSTTSKNEETSNIAGKSVELLKNILAEIRSYGEGFLIVDQSPTEVHSSAIKNTNTKIIMKLPDQEDRDIAAGSISATQEQADEIARLPIGVGAVYQTNWIQPILVKMDFWNSSQYRANEQILSYKSIRESRGILVNMLIDQYEANKYDAASLVTAVNRLNMIDSHKKADYRAIFGAYDVYYDEIESTFIQKNKEGIKCRCAFFAGILEELLGTYEFFDYVRLPVRTKELKERCEESGKKTEYSKDKEFIDATNRWRDKAISVLAKYVSTNEHYLLRVLCLLLRKNHDPNNLSVSVSSSVYNVISPWG